MDRDGFHASFGDTIDRLILAQRGELERRSCIASHQDNACVNDRFAISRGANEPKQRWVDGTPESSFYIAGLRHLFPQARFVHILRDPREVAASMLAFRQDNGQPLVDSAARAFDYWLRTTRACDLARRALGSRVVHRLHYADLVIAPEQTLRGVLDFLDEPWAGACLEPLAQRINSSHPNAPLLFAHATDTSAAEQALAFHTQLSETAGVLAPEAVALAQFEAGLARTVDHARNVDAYHENARRVLDRIDAVLNEGNGDISQFPRIIAEKQSEMDKVLANSRAAGTVCGVSLAVQWCLALAAWPITRVPVAGLALGVATIGCAVFLCLLHVGVREIVRNRLGRNATKGSQ